MKTHTSVTPVPHRSCSRRPGFTLIELLVVISVIALLIAVLLPALSSAKETSRRALCASNLRQVGIVCANYAASNRGEYPGVVWWGAMDVLGDGSIWVGPNNNWVNEGHQRKIQSYGMEKSILNCPSRKQLPRWWDSFPSTQLSTDYFLFFGRGNRRPKDPPSGSPIYGDSLDFHGWTSSYWRWNDGYKTRAPVYNDRAPRSMRTVLAYDRSWTSFSPGYYYDQGNPPTGYDSQSNHMIGTGEGYPYPVYAAGASYLILDGSVHWEKLDDGNVFRYGQDPAGNGAGGRDYYRTFVVGTKLKTP